MFDGRMTDSTTIFPRYRKILEIGPIPPPYAGWGVRIDCVLDALRDRNIETAALDLGANRKVRREKCDHVPSGFAYARKVLHYLLRGYRIHAHLNGESAKAYVLVLYSTLLSWMFRRPAVLTWHGGLGYRWFPSSGNRLVDFVHRRIFRLSETVICNDECVKRHIVAYGVPPQKVLCIPAFTRQYIAFETSPLPPEVARFLERKDPVLFCYAYFRPEFYLPELIEALRTLVDRWPNLGLLLVGFTADSEDIRQRVQAMGLGDHVLFAGDLERAEFLTALSRATLCVRTHQRDGISSSVLEALALGIPVVAAANPMRPPQVVTYQAEEPDDLVRAVTQVLALPQADRIPERPPVNDTVEDEVRILIGEKPGQVAVA